MPEKEEQGVDWSEKARKEREDRIEAGTASDEDYRLVKQYKRDVERGRVQVLPEEEKEGKPSAATTSSSTSSGQTPSSAGTTKPAPQSTAPETEQHSSRTPQGSSTASSTGTSGKANQ